MIFSSQVIDNLKTQPNMVTALLEELESRMADQEMRNMAWKLADEEDGYKVNIRDNSMMTITLLFTGRQLQCAQHQRLPGSEHGPGQPQQGSEHPRPQCSPAPWRQTQTPLPGE